MTSEMDRGHIYLAIDLKSFYASVECRERGLNPMTTNLVVADKSRTEKTICLAVSPSLKKYKIPGRARLFEVVQRVREINAGRKRKATGHRFIGQSWDDRQLQKNSDLALDYLVAPPRMALYMEYSTRIYQIYMQYIAPEDMHVYSIDEVFFDITHYLHGYKKTPRELAAEMIQCVYEQTGITATAGIGTNLYLCKIAMDIGAKHTEPDANGVRIAELDEQSYRDQLWNHRPLTDFWRVGRGYAKKLEAAGLFTMGDIAKCSVGTSTDIYNEDLLYQMFGINAELLIDHAWGYEPCTMEDIKKYQPENNSLGSGQVLACSYDAVKAKVVVAEMADALALDLLDKRLVTDQLVLTVGYDRENLANYRGELMTDRYGRVIPKHAHGTINLKQQTSSSKQMTEAVLKLYDRIVNPKLMVRRLNLVANHVVSEQLAQQKVTFEQMDLFTDYKAVQKQQEEEKRELNREKKMQQAMLDIKKKFGKNAILKGINMEEGATGKERNKQIGGHKA